MNYLQSSTTLNYDTIETQQKYLNFTYFKWANYILGFFIELLKCINKIWDNNLLIKN